MKKTSFMGTLAELCERAAKKNNTNKGNVFEVKHTDGMFSVVAIHLSGGTQNLSIPNKTDVETAVKLIETKTGLDLSLSPKKSERNKRKDFTPAIHSAG